MTIRIPLSMPYQPENTDYERVEGEITIHGIIYKYVKRKIDQGALVLLCLPDQRKMQLESGKDQFYQLANEFQQFTPKGHAPVKSTTIFKLSVFDLVTFRFCTPLPLTLHVDHTVFNHTFFPSPFARDAGQPPELVHSHLA